MVGGRETAEQATASHVRRGLATNFTVRSPQPRMGHHQPLPRPDPAPAPATSQKKPSPRPPLLRRLETSLGYDRTWAPALKLRRRPCLRMLGQDRLGPSPHRDKNSQR
jgi:hypothetical protein